jgi:hypothetical protein
MGLPVKLSVLILFLLGLAAGSCSYNLLGQGSTGASPTSETGEPSVAMPSSTAISSGPTDTRSPAPAVTATPSQAPAPGSNSPTAEACSNSAEFVQDVTIPDGEIVAPGASITKTWRLTNSGSCTWDGSYALVLVDGDLTGAPKDFPLSQTVPPGDSLDLSIPILVPQEPGDHHANWLLRDGRGRTFGVGPQGDWPIWVRVVVQGDQGQSDGRATPYADSPAAGICGKAEGDLATMTLLPGIPDPRCLIVSANQRLRVINRTEGTVEISLAGVAQTLEPDGSFTFTAEFGELLQPGVHALAVDPCCGGEIWLKE